VTLAADERLAVEAVTPAVLQAVTGWAARPDLPAGWRIASETDEATVLERIP